MAGSCGGSYCGYRPCRCGGTGTILTPCAVDATLARDLICPVDAARDIATQLGLRPYQVRRVWTRWKGGERNVGEELVVCEEPVLPTPRVDNMGALQAALDGTGLVEQGSVRLSEISASYTEDQLYGRGPAGEPVPEDMSYYWEINLLRPDSPGVRRRFTLKSNPQYDAGKVQWSLELERAIGDRERSGKPSE